MDKKQQPTRKDEKETKQHVAAKNEKTKRQTPDYDEMAEQNEKNRTRKPGSQSNSSDQNNNGRGGGR